MSSQLVTYDGLSINIPVPLKRQGAITTFSDKAFHILMGKDLKKDEAKLQSYSHLPGVACAEMHLTLK